MSNHTIINKVDGVYVCGNNEKGQLGLGDNTNRNILTKLPPFCDESEEIISVCLGEYHTVFQTNKGVYTCGLNKYGQLGLDDNRDRNIPTKLSCFYDENAEIISIYCGRSHTIFHTTNGIYVCGLNDEGQLGLGDNNDRNSLTKLHNFHYEIISISCGGWHTIFHTTDGVYVCGDNYFGQSGLQNCRNINIPTKLDFNHEIISISSGAYHTIFHTTEGLYVCGDNGSGQLGLGDNHDRKIPTKLLCFHNENEEIVFIFCSAYHTIIHTMNGLYACGFNNDGQLGLGDYNSRNIPTKLNFDHEIISISCGSYHTIFHATDGLYACGLNYHGQLGLGDNVERNVPTKLNFDHEGIIVTGRMKRFKTMKVADPNL